MLFKVENIYFRYNKKGSFVIENVSLSVESGERVGLIAPSGYGKSTFGKIAAGFLKPYFGSITIDGEKIPEKGYYPVQMIYQHPELAVNPRWKMKKILNESFDVSEELMEKMGIEKEWLKRWPCELSGGELQRFCIARILNDMTKFIICDEITAMFDAITQAQIWNILIEIAEKRNYGIIVITHNKALAHKVCTRIVDLEDLGGSASKPPQAFKKA